MSYSHKTENVDTFAPYGGVRGPLKGDSGSGHRNFTFLRKIFRAGSFTFT